MINLLAVVFQIMFVPGTLLLWSQHKHHDMRGLVFQASLLTQWWAGDAPRGHRQYRAVVAVAAPV